MPLFNTEYIKRRAQLIANELLQRYGGDSARAYRAAEDACLLGTMDEGQMVRDAVLALLRPPEPIPDIFPADLLDEFIRDALAILDPGPVTLKPELRSAVLKSIIQLARKAEARCSAAIDEAADLRKFKTFVHRRLDEYQVPSDPFPEENAKHGCRISGRLQWLNERRMTLEHAEVLTRFLVPPPAGADLNALRDALVALQRCAEILP
jgi:hypothetical protein